MNLERISVLPRLPMGIGRLEELAYNLWWSWEPKAQRLYEELDPLLWESVRHNPVKLLHRVAQERLDAAARNDGYLAAYAAVLATFDAYMNPQTPTWFSRRHADQADQVIAYFSAEFGLHEALPIYSGGLGILSGDHCKSASDLGLPFIGVGFLYPQGYFTQRVDAGGRQQAEYEKIDFAEVPARPALDTQGQEVLISVDLPGRTVYAKVWRIQVGRIPVFLMDTDVPRNAPQDRELSARLYGGDREMRISQEIVLGIGGVRAAYALGYDPAVWHMNEGHSAFLGLERVRRKLQQHGLSFDEAVEAVRSNTLFTTHTPVPAGNDAFAFELVDKYFWNYWGQLGIDRERFVQFARQELPWGPQYSMTVLALRLSAYHNGVSKLHGEVSRKMWSFLWPDTPEVEIPIGAITNGVHTKTWLAHDLRELYARHLAPDWEDNVEQSAVWRAIDTVPDAELWEVHRRRKEHLIRLVRQRVRDQYVRNGEGPARMATMDQLLDPNALTIGFARRFATYKRAVLLFRDPARIQRILNDPARPVQIIFSGKAHPDDEPGKALIQQIYALSQQPELAGKVVFVEDYDMHLARNLVAGVDVWINTPRRPREASGTSGQKAALCGVPSFSVLDGWWAEGYDGENGWAIGEEREYKDQDTQDDADAHSLYSLLEEAIVPLFYSGDATGGAPSGWLRVIKNAIRTCAPTYSMQRMVIDYVNEYYLPAAVTGRRYHEDGFLTAKQVVAWRANLHERWRQVRIERSLLAARSFTVGDQIPLQAKIWLAGIEPRDVTVEVVAGRQDAEGKLTELSTYVMTPSGQADDATLYTGAFAPSISGPLVVGVRVRAHHEAQIQRVESGLVRWA